MAKKIDSLKASLFATDDGSVACKAINALRKFAEKGDEDAIEVLAAYAVEGPIDHMRTHACACLAELVTEEDVKYAKLFRRGLSDENRQFWSILGCIRVEGKRAYDALIRIARSKTVRLEVRCHAVKCLAQYSKQPFDRKLPSDLRWGENELRLDEIAQWKRQGYPDGQGYLEPKRHAALDKPKTPFEKIVSRLDTKLAKKRKAFQDPSEPTDWLAVASPEDIREIKNRWDLPALYLDFLKRFSPIRVTLESRRFYNPFELFGAGELINAQDGYAYNIIEEEPLEDWPVHLVVVANHGGDPFVLDLSKSDGNDAPVYTAEHGAGAWDFTKESASFGQFLEKLAK